MANKWIHLYLNNTPANVELRDKLQAYCDKRGLKYGKAVEFAIAEYISKCPNCGGECEDNNDKNRS